jgi:bifunctional DNA-binding transcriptional regulator/antitoxin component of YhaV-PrlF toxin-antitoxin module
MTIETMEKYIRKIGKASKWSYNVVIPKEIIEKYGWREKQKIVLEDKGRGKIEIRDWRKK